jgi:FkbM family methyltransferase
MSRIERALRLLCCEPVLFAEVFAGKLRMLLPTPGQPVLGRIGEVLFEFDFSLGHAVKAMYWRAYEPLTIAAMRRLLKPGDVFFDIGASVGYLTAVGASLVGRQGQVHSFEPVPECFERLGALSASNPEFRTVVNNFALGDKDGARTIDLCETADIGWNTMVPGFMPPESRTRTITVTVRTLDSYVRERRLADIALVKIDVEGFELPVLRGFSEYLRSTGRKPAIICEVAPQAYPLLGCTLEDLTRCMAGFGYSARSLITPHRTIDLARLAATTIVLFLPGSG